MHLGLGLIALTYSTGYFMQTATIQHTLPLFSMWTVENSAKSLFRRLLAASMAVAFGKYSMLFLISVSSSKELHTAKRQAGFRFNAALYTSKTLAGGARAKPCTVTPDKMYIRYSVESCPMLRMHAQYKTFFVVHSNRRLVLTCQGLT